MNPRSVRRFHPGSPHEARARQALVCVSRTVEPKPHTVVFAQLSDSPASTPLDNQYVVPVSWARTSGTESEVVEQVLYTMRTHHSEMGADVALVWVGALKIEQIQQRRAKIVVWPSGQAVPNT